VPVGFENPDTDRSGGGLLRRASFRCRIHGAGSVLGDCNAVGKRCVNLSAACNLIWLIWLWAGRNIGFDKLVFRNQFRWPTIRAISLAARHLDAQSCTARRKIMACSRRKLIETDGTVRRTLSETERALVGTDARSCTSDARYARLIAI
jgi:hypothetical protein